MLFDSDKAGVSMAKIISSMIILIVVIIIILKYFL